MTWASPELISRRSLSVTFLEHDFQIQTCFMIDIVVSIVNPRMNPGGLMCRNDFFGLGLIRMGHYSRKEDLNKVDV